MGTNEATRPHRTDIGVGLLSVILREAVISIAFRCWCIPKTKYRVILSRAFRRRTLRLVLILLFPFRRQKQHQKQEQTQDPSAKIGPQDDTVFKVHSIISTKEPSVCPTAGHSNAGTALEKNGKRYRVRNPRPVITTLEAFVHCYAWARLNSSKLARNRSISLGSR
jgi:hypothetical protein